MAVNCRSAILSVGLAVTKRKAHIAPYNSIDQTTKWGEVKNNAIVRLEIATSDSVGVLNRRSTIKGTNGKKLYAGAAQKAQ